MHKNVIKYDKIYANMNTSDKILSHPIIIIIFFGFIVLDLTIIPFYIGSIVIVICLMLGMPWSNIAWKRGYITANILKTLRII